MSSVVLYGYGRRINCHCGSDETLINHLRNFDADFGLSKCIVKNAGVTVVQFAKENFGNSSVYTVEETEDGLLVSFVA